MLPYRLDVAGSIVSTWEATATIALGGSTGLSTANEPRQFSKVGIIAGAEGFEVMERWKTGSSDMPVEVAVAQEKDEQVDRRC